MPPAAETTTPTGAAYFIFTTAFWLPNPKTGIVPFLAGDDPKARRFRRRLMRTVGIDAVLLNTFTLRVDYRAPLDIFGVVAAVDDTMCWAEKQSKLFPGRGSQKPGAFLKRVRPMHAAELPAADEPQPAWLPFVVVLPPRECQ